MGWNPFKDSWSKEYKKTEDSVKGVFKDIDNDLNISENKDALIGLATGGQLGYLAGSAYGKAKEQEELAKKAARAATEARLAANRTVNFRSMMKAAESTQQSAAELMNLAASGGFADSSAIMQAMSSGKSQQLEEGKYKSSLDTLGISEATALDAQATAEKKYAKKMGHINTGLGVLGSIAGGAIGG